MPYNDLTWQNFELLVAEVIFRNAEFRDVHNYGAAPDPQAGIDIVARKGDEVWGFQCKRVQRFGAAEFARAEKSATFSAHKFVLVISCNATTPLIDAVSEQASRWELWDARDLDRRIASLPEAFTLVEAYFGRDWASAFLGERRTGIFLSSGDFFQPFTRPDRVTSVVGELVDRIDVMKALNTFVQGSSERLAILSGPVGIGKTKILFEAAKATEAQHQRMFFVREGAELDDDALANMPRGAIVVADDPERIVRFENLISYIARDESSRLLVTTTPEKLDSLLLQAQAYGFDVSEILTLPPLARLGRDDTFSLTRQTLNETDVRLAETIYTASSGLPLIVRIIGFLVNRGATDILTSIRDEDHPIDLLLSRYDIVLRGDILSSRNISPENTLEIMRLLAAIGPVDIRTADFREKASQFLNWPPGKVAETLNALEAAGILARVGSKSRIVPELLRLFILKRACLAGTQPTGYAERIVTQFGYDAQVMMNLALVDTIGSQPGAVFGDVWRQLKEQVKSSFAPQRALILDGISQLGYILPREMLELVEFIMNNPALPDPEQPLQRLHVFGNSDVLSKLGPVLKSIALSDIALVRRCVQLLWTLGKDEDASSLQENAFGTLVSLASYGRYKSVLINLEVLKEIQLIARRGSEQHFRHLPIDVIAPVLAKSFHSSETVKGSAVISKFIVSAEKVTSVRDKALDVLSEALTSSNMRAALKSVSLLSSCLRPHEGPQNSVAEDIWNAEAERVLDILEQGLKPGNPPALQLKIITSLSWHAQLDRNEHIRQRCAALINDLEGNPELEFVASLVPDFARHLPSVRVGGSYQELQASIDHLLKRVVSRILSQRVDARSLVAHLSETITELSAMTLHPSAGWFFVELSNIDQNYAKRATDNVIDRFGRSLGEAISPVLHRAWLEDPEWTDSAVSRILKSNEASLYLSLANALWLHEPNSRLSSVNEAQRRASLLRSLFEMPDPNVREAVLRAVGTLGSIDRTVALKLIVEINPGDNTKTVDEIFANLREVDPNTLDTETTDKLLSKLISVDDLDYWAFEFLRKLAKVNASSVLDLLLKRIERSSEIRSKRREYRPVPYGRALLPHVVMFFQEMRLSRTALFDALDRSFSLDAMGRYWFGQLVSNLALNSQPLAEAFGAWGYEANADRLQFAAEALRDVPAEFIFDHVSLVSKMISVAQSYGEDCFSNVQRSLFAAATGGARSGRAFEPMPQDIAMIESAKAARCKLIAGSPEERFFATIEEYGEDSVRRQREHDIDALGEPT